MMEETQVGGRTQNAMLQGQFRVNGSRTFWDVVLTSAVITCSSREEPRCCEGRDKQEILVSIDDIIGTSCYISKHQGADVANLEIYACPFRRTVPLRKRLRVHKMLTLSTDASLTYVDNQAKVERWKNTILTLMKAGETGASHAVESTPISDKKMLVLINPASGQGKAEQMFHKQVQPFLIKAAIPYSSIVTERQNHAKDLVKSLDLDQWLGIVTISGDGLVYEVIQGLMSRPDWEWAIQTPLGVLPGGSGNALSCSINYLAGEPFRDAHMLHALHVIARHQVLALDLVAVDTIRGRVYSTQTLSWGMAADVDIESEKYRCVGDLRFTIGALQKIIALKKYAGRLAFLPAYDEFNPGPIPGLRRVGGKTPEHLDSGPGGYYNAAFTAITDIDIDTEDRLKLQNDTHQTAEHNDSSLHNDSHVTQNNAASLNVQPEQSDEMRDVVRDYHRDDGNDVAIVPTPLLNPLSESVPDDWYSLETDDFTLVMASYMPLASADMMFAPDSKLSDGLIHLMFLTGISSRLSLLKSFIQLEDGSHVGRPGVHMVAVKAFRIEPITESGLIAVDGERVAYGPVQAQVMPCMARLMAR